MNRLVTFIGIVFLAIGSFFFYIGLREYLFPNGWRTLHGATAYAGIGF